MAKLRVFTDGACSGNPGPGGWAVAVALEEDNEMLSGHEMDTTNNRMELMAVISALELINQKYGYYNQVEVHSDSAYVVKAITNNWLHGWKSNGWRTASKDEVKNKDLWKRLDEQLVIAREANRSVTFVKVKGHAGNLMNEIVDVRARGESIIAKKKQEAGKR